MQKTLHQHLPPSPTARSLLPGPASLRRQSCPSPFRPENLRGLDGPSPRGSLTCVEGAHWPHRLCSPRGYSPQPAFLFLPQAPAPLHIFKYVINKHLELNHIFQLVKINFSYPHVSPLSPAFPRTLIRTNDGGSGRV